MRRRRDEPREIPIKFKDGGKKEHEAKETIADGKPGEGTKVEQPVAVDDPTPVAADEPEIAGNPGAGAELANSDLQEQVDTLIAEKSALYDQLLRRQAEFENYRKRVERERGETFQRARADVLLEMLPVLDNLERALASLEQSEGDADALRHGVELVHRQFKDALTKLGLQPVESVGRTFDPNLHEAVTIEPTDEHQENTIIEEFQRGYKMGDRLLRPAKVKVASNPER